jgi:hypothetical protein
MKKLKKLPMALTMMGLGAASSFAEIKVTDNLSVSGFLDMSSTYDDVSEAMTASFDQLELDFMLKFGNVSAQADINSLGGGAVEFEQGFITGSMGGLGLTVGKFLSSSGFEAAEPTGLYQFSVSKNLDGPAGAVYGGYQNGVALSYGADKFALYGSVVSSVWNGSDTDIETPGFEVQASLMPMEGITAKVAYLYENELTTVDDTGAVTDSTSQSLLNIWAQYAKGAVTVAGEYNMLLDWGAADETGHGWLAMANYKVTDQLAATVRYSGIKVGDLDPDTEITFSPSYALTGNWLVLAEVKRQLDAEVTNFAVESLFTF